MKRKRKRIPIADRFHNLYTPEPNSGCWLWEGSVNNKGYGQITNAHHRHEWAHRLSYQLHNGPIPDGMCVLHRCDVPSCVNPDHLWLGSKGDNARDRDMKGRHWVGNHQRAWGERQGSAKLTNEQAAEIRSASGTLQEIGARYGIVKSTVGRIKSGKTWRHLP